MPVLTAITGNPTIPLRQERELAKFRAGARDCIADLKAHFENDVHLTPEQLADYRHRLDRYARSGSKPAQPDLDLPPCA